MIEHGGRTLAVTAARLESAEAGVVYTDDVLAAGAARAADRYSWDTIAAETEAVYYACVRQERKVVAR